MSSQIKNEWSLSVPTHEDADDDGNILVRAAGYSDALPMGGFRTRYPSKKISLTEYLGKWRNYYWRKTDEWISSREVFERRVIQIAGLNEEIAALADDGSVWIGGRSSGWWLVLDGLPSGIRKKRPRGEEDGFPIA